MNYFQKQPGTNLSCCYMRGIALRKIRYIYIYTHTHHTHTPHTTHTHTHTTHYTHTTHTPHTHTPHPHTHTTHYTHTTHTPHTHTTHHTHTHTHTPHTHHTQHTPHTHHTHTRTHTHTTHTQTTHASHTHHTHNTHTHTHTHTPSRLFAMFRQATISFVVSVRLSAWSCSAPSGQIFHEIWYLPIFLKSVAAFPVSSQSHNNNNRSATAIPIYSMCVCGDIWLNSQNEKCFRQKLWGISKHTFCVQQLF
jgi:magnesium-transporting ATPase (P-type)